jgi:carboxymethylenebutenolidase
MKLSMKLRMVMGVGVIVGAVILAAGLFVQAGPKNETVQIKSGDETISGYLSEPEGAGKHPGIVVIHEWWGLNDWVKGEADKLAEQGYVALAVDLYRGKVATDPNTAHELMRGMPQDRAVRDMKAAVDYLVAQKNVDAKRIGSIGWCMGGGLSLQLAIHDPRITACVVNYGSLPTDAADIQAIKAPVLGNFGAEDKGITPADVHAFEKAMKDAGKSVDLKIYDGAGHGFQNPNNKDAYRADATADAWSRITEFFKKTLK